MVDAAAEPPRTQMSLRDRRRVYIAFALGALVLFLSGMAGYIFDFRHQQVCPNGKQWLYQSSDEMGAITYICPDGKTTTTVTQGMVP